MSDPSSSEKVSAIVLDWLQNTADPTSERFILSFVDGLTVAFLASAFRPLILQLGRVRAAELWSYDGQRILESVLTQGYAAKPPSGSGISVRNNLADYKVHVRNVGSEPPSGISPSRAWSVGITLGYEDGGDDDDTDFLVAVRSLDVDFTTLESPTEIDPDTSSKSPLTAEDIEVVLDDIPNESEAELRRWLEPLLGRLTRAIDEGAFADAEIERRLTQDRDYLAAQLRETELGELRVGLVVQLAFSIVKALSGVVSEPGATEAGELALLAGDEVYAPQQVIAQRDYLAERIGVAPESIDRQLFAETGNSLNIVAAVAGIFVAFLEGGTAGVLLGTVIAIMILVVRFRPK